MSRKPIAAAVDDVQFWKSECERLQTLVARLQEEQNRDRRALGELQHEYEAHRKAVYAWAKAEFAKNPGMTDEELIRGIQNADGVPLKDFLPELERICKGQ